jgi:hypothetical protein
MPQVKRDCKGLLCEGRSDQNSLHVSTKKMAEVLPVVEDRPGPRGSQPLPCGWLLTHILAPALSLSTDILKGTRANWSGDGPNASHGGAYATGSLTSPTTVDLRDAWGIEDYWK